MDDLGLPNDLGNLYFLMNLGNEVHPTSTAGADDEGTTNQKESEQDQVQDVPSWDHGCVPMLALRFEPNWDDPRRWMPGISMILDTSGNLT